MPFPRAARATRWTRSVLIFFAFVTIFAATPASAEWRRIDSPNFVVVGDVGARTLRDVAVKFEGFRETLGRVLSDKVTATAVPTVVIVFPSDRAFTPFKPKFRGKGVQVDALFLGADDVNYIAVRSDLGDEGLRLVFHEYAHLIISNIARNIPLWLNEGLAEYYSTFALTDGGKQADIGMPVGSHITILNMEPLLRLEQLLKVDHDSPLYNEGSRRSVFYAQSWALTHMLLLGNPPRVQQFAEYLHKLGGGIPAYDLWQQVMGGLPIENDLQKYVRLKSYNYRRYTFSEKVAAFDGTVTTLAPADAEAFLADFLIQQDREPEALERLARAAKTSPASPPSAWGAVIAALAQMDKDPAATESQLLSIPDGADWLTAYRAGAAIADIVQDRGERPSAGSLEAARRYFTIAQSGRDLPNTAARLASIELAANDAQHSTRTAMERAWLEAPGRLDYVFLHARMLAMDGQFVEARTVLAPLITTAYPPTIREPASKLMGYIVQVEKAYNARFGGANGRPAGSPSVAPAAGGGPPAPATPAAAPSSSPDAPPAGRGGGFRPIFRKLDAGESRLEGVLEHIECVQTGAVLHVRTPDGVVRVTAGRMQDVEFITFRDDLKGSVRCGPVKEQPRVYVAWKAGAEAGSKVAVAVELLPK